MARAFAKNIAVGLIVGLTAAAVCLGSVMAAQAAAPMPDFSGLWVRVAMDPELLPSGPKPLVNLRRPMDDPHPNGGGDPLPLVGHYNNPILKQRAVEAVQTAGDGAEGGGINPEPPNQCAPA